MIQTVVRLLLSGALGTLLTFTLLSVVQDRKENGALLETVFGDNVLSLGNALTVTLTILFVYVFDSILFSGAIIK